MRSMFLKALPKLKNTDFKKTSTYTALKDKQFM